MPERPVAGIAGATEAIHGLRLLERALALLGRPSPWPDLGAASA
jgi:hypothetical protein